MISKSFQITTDSKVKFHYSISLTDGTEVVSTFAETPLVCRMGDGTLAERLELCLIGMSEGDKGTFILSGDEVFGPSVGENIQCLEKTAFPANMSLSTGQVIAFTTPAGDELAGIVESLTDNEVVVNFNHPLSGQLINFQVQILEVVNSYTDSPR